MMVLSDRKAAKFFIELKNNNKHPRTHCVPFISIALVRRRSVNGVGVTMEKQPCERNIAPNLLISGCALSNFTLNCKMNT